MFSACCDICFNVIVGYKSSWELMLFVVMYNMPTLNKIYLLTYLLTHKMHVNFSGFCQDVLLVYEKLNMVVLKKKIVSSWDRFWENWQEAKFQRRLTWLCFSGRSEKQDGHPGVWFAEAFSTSLKLLNRIQWNLTDARSQQLHPLQSLFFFWADPKNKMVALASDWLRQFYFS